MAKIAVLGYGTVGSGVVEVLETNKNSIEKRAGEGIEVKYVLDLRDFPGDPVQEKIVHDVDIIIQDKEIDVVVEVMGGIEPAFTFVKKALEAGKSVCTSNKALVAEHGPELLAMAKERNLNFMFEASVGGGIPIIRPLNQSLTADEITQITGILNGTTNYILTKMSQEGSSYEDVLKDEAVVYSYGIDLTKTFSDNNGDATKVQFVAKNTSRLTDGQTATYYLVANKVSDGQYHVTGETTNADDATVFSPDNNGKINVYGLEENSYSLTEIATDKGYTLLKEDIKVDIKKTDATITASVASVRGQDNPNANVIYTKNASASAKVDTLKATMDSKADSTNALVKLSVENNKSFPIPPTGVMGTFVITLAGFAMMAVGLTYGKGKKKKEEA